QRALRIEPLADDVRERAELVHALPFTAAGYVPPVPSSWAFGLAAVLWFGAWGIAAYRVKRGDQMQGRQIATLAVAAGVIAIVGFALADRPGGGGRARTASHDA